MGLIDLRSNLTSLKFGNDTKGGGTSNMPYITKPIPDELFPTTQDFLLRDGTLHFERVGDDVERLTKYFTDVQNPAGILFTVKQEMLSRHGVKTERSPDILNEGIYTPFSTIGQSAVVSTGGHLNKQGVGPTGNFEFTVGPEGIGLNPDLPGYGQIVHEKNLEGNNRILQLVKKHITPYNPTDDISLYEYEGGPGSILGIGKTSINFGTGPGGEKLSVNNYRLPVGNQPLVGKGATFTKEMFEEFVPDTVLGRGTGLSEIPDFREAIRKAGVRTVYTDYTTFNRESTFKTANLGRRGKNLIDNNSQVDYLSTNDPVLADLITKAEVRYNTNEQDVEVQELLKSDIVQFSLKTISNDTPSRNDVVVFRAYLESLNDNVSSDVVPYNYIGRGDKFYRNVGFERRVGLSFKVACMSRQEQLGMYSKLNYMQSLLTPDYSDIGYARSNIVKLTIGNYLKDVPGIITNLNYDIPVDHAWDIGRDLSGELVGPQLPMYITVSSFDFIVLHGFIPGKAKELDDKPFISGVQHENLGGKDV